MFMGKQFFKTHFNLQIFTYCVNAIKSSLLVPHVPVLCSEAIEYLNPRPQQIFIDMTFGGGGHTVKLFDKCEDITIFALDRDPIAYNLAINLSDRYPGRLMPLWGKFSDLPQLLNKNNINYNSVDGILFDFGCSYMQLDVSERGFSIFRNGPLDMRMDRTNKMNNKQITAAEVLARIEETDLVKILSIYGEEKAAKRVARTIVGARSALNKIETTRQLADLVDSCLNRSKKMKSYTHAATKTFQALRIFVNNELNEINYGIMLANKYLRLHGRLVTITFHSLEDAIVKRHLNGNVIQGLPNTLPLKYCSHHIAHNQNFLKTFQSSKWKQMHKNVIVPTEQELIRNIRCRSAKLRAAIKI